MRILALNCGSSSIKSAVIDSARWERVLNRPCREDIGHARLRASESETQKRLGADTTYTAALQSLSFLDEVHRGRLGAASAERMPSCTASCMAASASCVRRSSTTRCAIENRRPLAPLHNPPALAALTLAPRLCRHMPHVAVFDTAFHATLPPRAREYALPSRARQQYGMRRYGFHGVSHAHVMRQRRGATCSAEPQSCGSSRVTSAAARASRPSSTGAASTPAWA